MNNTGQRLADGLNNITKSIMQQRGVQQIEAQDDIPLRPLLLNGNQANGNQLQVPQNE